MPDDSNNFTVEIEDSLEPLIPKFFNEMESDVQEIREMMDDDDFEGLKRQGHSLKGVGAGYGFDFISSLGKKIESAAEDEDKESITNLVKKLDDYIENVEIQYV